MGLEIRIVVRGERRVFTGMRVMLYALYLVRDIGYLSEYICQTQTLHLRLMHFTLKSYTR